MRSRPDRGAALPRVRRGGRGGAHGAPLRRAQRPSRNPCRAIALLVAALTLAAFVYFAAGAQAQTAVCSDTPAAGQRIECTQPATARQPIDIDASDVTIQTTSSNEDGVSAKHDGTGKVTVRVRRGNISTTGDSAKGISVSHAGNGNIAIRVEGGGISTTGDFSDGIRGNHAGTGDIDIDIRGALIATAGRSAFGVYGQAIEQDAGNVSIYLEDVAIESHSQDLDSDGDTYSHGVFVLNMDSSGHIGIDMRGGSVETMGVWSNGVWGHHTGIGDIDIDIRGARIKTSGASSEGVSGTQVGEGDIRIILQNTVIETAGVDGDGLFAENYIQFDEQPPKQGNVDIAIRGGSITTKARNAWSVWAFVGERVTGDIRIHLEDVDIRTEGTEVDSDNRTYSVGVAARHSGQGNIGIVIRGGRILTSGAASHGIFVRHDGQGPSRSTNLSVGGTVVAAGEDADGIRIGQLGENGGVEGAAALAGDGYRKQTVRVNGRVLGGSGVGAGIYLAGGGRVIIGPQGHVGATSGTAIRAVGDTVVEGQTIPRRLLVHLLPGGNLVSDLLGGIIKNDGGQTVVLVHGTAIYDSENGGPQFVWAPNGPHDIRLVDGFTGMDFTSPDSFIMRTAPRAAVYEALPGALLRIENGGGIGEGKLRTTDSPLWLRLDGGFGTYRPRHATVGGRYRYSRYRAEAGMDFRIDDGLTGWLGVRLVSGAARVSSPAGGGRIAALGYGLSGGLDWQGNDGWYGTGSHSLTRYSADISSAARGRLRKGANALVHAVNLEGGRRFSLGGKTTLTALAWLSRSGVSMGNFRDAVYSEVSFGGTRRVIAGAGAVVETGMKPNGGADALTLRGELGAERAFGGDTAVTVSGTRLTSKAPPTGLLLGVGGTYRSGGLTLHGALRANGLVSGDTAYSARLELRTAF